MGTPAVTEGWTGWAISSFTNKMAGASGDIQAKSPNQATFPGGNRPSSVPPGETLGAERSGSSDLHRKALGAAVPSITRTQSDQGFASAPLEDDADDFEAAWGEMGDMDDDVPEDADDDDAGASKGVAAAFAAPPKRTVKSPPATAPAFDDSGEPDFAAWLNAKAASKTKGPLPKGLAKKSAAPAAKKPAAKPAAKPVVKPISTKPKQEDEDDGWGDAWD